MKIKMKKKMRLDELIKHIYDNEIENASYIDDEEKFIVESNNTSSVQIELHKRSGLFTGYLNKRRLFTVEVEEDVTEKTRFDELYEVYYDAEGRETRGSTWEDCSVEGILDNEMEDFTTLAIFFKDELLWTDKDGLLEGEE